MTTDNTKLKVTGPTFDPQWSRNTRVYGRGGFNMDTLRLSVDLAGEQLEAVTAIINEYERRLHELETRVAELKTTLTQLTMTDPKERKGKPGASTAAEGGVS